MTEPWRWWPGRSASDLVDRIADWSRSPALARLVRRATAGEVPDGDDSGGDPLDRLAAVAAAHWDLRRGRERHDVDTAPHPLDGLVLEAAAELGLRGEREPARGHYDWVLVLGGLVRACLVRPRHLGILMAGGLSVGQVVGLGGFRPLSGDEISMARQFGLTATDEFGCLVEGLRRALGPGRATGTRAVAGTGQGTDGDPRRRQRIDRWHLPGGTPVAAVAAPSGDPVARRANTADGYAYWVERFGPRPGQSVLVVTNPIYVPYQGCVAARLLGLGHGLAVETVGAGAAAGDLGGRTPGFSPRHYLQEITATVTAMRHLRDAALAGAVQQSGMVWSQSSAELSPS